MFSCFNWRSIHILQNLLEHVDFLSQVACGENIEGRLTLKLSLEEEKGSVQNE